MNIETASWRSIVCYFCSVRTILKTKCQFKLLSLAFQHFLLCLMHIARCLFKACTKYLCVGIYLAGLLIWCTYFCIAVRFYFLLSHFITNHPVMFICIHQWWIFALILKDGDIHPNPGPKRNLLKFMHWNLNSLVAHDGIRALV